ncbi:MAG: glucosyl-3-phosphoglycerate phosphatase [Actinomycetota bacterium]|nr:glucosyl-3-phosphoglycerate phosphatase [Actinomycetota bacterium]
MTAGTVVLWRHGRTEHNLHRIWQGQLDIPLDEIGRQQAARAAQALLAELTAPDPSGSPPAPAAPPTEGPAPTEPPSTVDLGDRTVDLGDRLRIVTSDLSRAARTAEALSEVSGVPVLYEKRLREVNVGSWQGRTRAEIMESDTGPQLKAWLDGEDVPLGGGERRSEAGTRGAQAVAEHAQALDGGTLVAVSHGGIINGSIATLLGLGPARWGILGVLGNARWATLAHGDRGWRLTGYNLGP